MPTQKTVTAYTFDELSEQAKNKARDWFRSSLDNEDIMDGVITDADNVNLQIHGWDIDRGGECELSFTRGASDTAALILENHGKECDTYKAALKFNAEIERLAALDEEEEELEAQTGMDEARAAFLVELGDCYLDMLRKEYEYRMSDEAVDEDIRANEYLFTESGSRTTVL